MGFSDQFKERMHHEQRSRPLTYFAYLGLLLVGIIWNAIPGLMVILGAGPADSGTGKIVALLFLLLLIPEYLMLRAYLAMKSIAVDYMNISFALAAILHIVAAHWSWVIILAVVWYLLSDFMRFKEHNGAYLFKE